MTEDEKIIKDAHDYVKNNRQLLIVKFANPQLCFRASKPVSLFMAGSPGAGKTEVSKRLMKEFENVPIRIDADDIRAICPFYLPEKAHLFQNAASKGVNMLLDYAHDKEINFILDGTFAYAEALNNIERSIRHKRVVELWFIYQKPELAWGFTKAREAIECRHVFREKFIEAFLKSKNNVIKAKEHFGESIKLNLMIKNIDNTPGRFQLNIKADEVDQYLGESYTEEALNVIIL